MACAHIGSKLLTEKTCLDVYVLADMYSCAGLKSESLTLIYRQFESLSNTEGFYQLNSSQIHDIISNEDLVVESEESVFEALLRWVEYDGQRKKDFPDLFRKIRLPYVERASPEDRVGSKKFVREIKELSDLVARALSKPDQECGESKKRKSVDNPGFFFFAYADEDECLKVFSYIPHKDEWYTLPYEPDTEILYLDELLFDKGNMYILNDVLIYILTDDMDLSRLKDSPLAAHEFRAASLNGYIYAVGGFDIERDTSPCLRAVQ